MSAKKNYRWPNLARVQRQYLVVDVEGRYGLAHTDEGEMDTIAARPVDAHPEVAEGGAIMMGMICRPALGWCRGSTIWHLRAGGTYTGIWYDYTGPRDIPDDMLRRITIVQDLGYLMPEWVADQALAGSGQRGHWDYGATLGKVGGQQPLVVGQNPDEMTVEQAEDYAREVGELVSRRGIRLAARNGYIPGARKAGRDWLIPYDGFNHYLDDRPKPGRKPNKKQGD